MKFKILTFLICTFSHAQVGINTNDPKGVFHIDPKGNNNNNDLSNSADDLIFTYDGKLGIGTITPNSKLQIIGDGTNHPLNIKNLQPLIKPNELVYIDENGNIGTYQNPETQNNNQIFILNAKIPTRGPQNSESNNGYNTSLGIDMYDINSRSYLPWDKLTGVSGGLNQTTNIISNTLNAQIENTNYIKVPKNGYYSVQVQGAFSCSKEFTTTDLSYYALDVIMYKSNLASINSLTEIERKRIIVGRNDSTSYAGSFYTVIKLNENEYISFSIAPGLNPNGSPIVNLPKSAYHCGIGTPSGNTSNFSSIALILL